MLSKFNNYNTCNILLLLAYTINNKILNNKKKFE